MEKESIDYKGQLHKHRLESGKIPTYIKNMRKRRESVKVKRIILTQDGRHVEVR